MLMDSEKARAEPVELEFIFSDESSLDLRMNISAIRLLVSQDTGKTVLYTITSRTFCCHYVSLEFSSKEFFHSPHLKGSAAIKTFRKL